MPSDAFVAQQNPIIQVLEEGDLFFFYRPRVGVEKVEARDDVQRFYMIVAPRRPRRGPFRMLVIGRKKLPEVLPDAAHPDERNWAMVVFTASDAEAIRRELSAKRYMTATHGERVAAAAKPVAEGRYQLVRHESRTELAYVLELPELLGPAQEVFEIKKEASYIVAVRNPEMPPPPEIPAPKQQPKYPMSLKEKFGAHRWIPVDDLKLLDYRNTQLVLLGAHAGAVQEELGIRIEKERETVYTAELFRLLRLNREEIPLEPLFHGKFPNTELPPRSAEIDERHSH